MKTEKEQEINNYVETTLTNLNEADLKTAKALCRAAYRMGFDDGKKVTGGTLEVIGADGIIEALNNRPL